MHALSSSMRTKTPANPRSPTTFTAKSTRRSVTAAISIGRRVAWPPVAIPLFAGPLAPYQDAIADKLRDVAASGRYILGPEVKAFEDEFAEWLGARPPLGGGRGNHAAQTR